MKTVYGPVPSWRFGHSFGIDPICLKKACSFDCVYCQLGKTTEKTVKRREFIRPEDLKKDLKEALEKKVRIDYITFSGTGEPELASNLGELITLVQQLKPDNVPVAVLANSSLMNDKQVRQDLALADVVSAKLDAPDQALFEEVNQPHPSIVFDEMLEGMKKFRKEFKGKFMLQMMFLKQTKNHAREMADIAKQLRPDLVQLDTPLRPCGVKPLSLQEMEEVTQQFEELPNISVYREKKIKTDPLDEKETFERRPGEGW
jgi:wyosine [tRNA(Phe)-imidazoG37] synthetase (radical SAM superfamily)